MKNCTQGLFRWRVSRKAPEREVEYPVVSFGSIYQSLLKDGKLTGRFVIEVAVSEILYADGSRWKRR